MGTASNGLRGQSGVGNRSGLEPFILTLLKFARGFTTVGGKTFPLMRQSIN